MNIILSKEYSIWHSVQLFYHHLLLWQELYFGCLPAASLHGHAHTPE